VDGKDDGSRPSPKARWGRVQFALTVPALEDKILQKAMVEVLNAIYEQDFLDCSYGFRPGRGPHQALDEVGRVICTRPTGWILEIDITAYLDTSSYCPLIHEVLSNKLG
jgi:RNA-directed DNA polymerase